MKKVRIGIMVVVLAGVAGLSGAQNFRYFYSSALVDKLENSYNAIDKKKAMRQLSMRREPDAVPGILDQLDSPYLDVRLTAIKALSRYQDPEYLDLYEDTILDYDGLYTVQERVAALRGYVFIEGYDPDVLQKASRLAEHPFEKEMLKRAINNQKFIDIRKGR